MVIMHDDDDGKMYIVKEMGSKLIVTLFTWLGDVCWPITF